MFSCSGVFCSYVAAAVALDQETNGSMRKFEVCDNVDLEMVLMEYESYHHVKFQKYPKLTRRTAEAGEEGCKTLRLRSTQGSKTSCFLLLCEGDDRLGRSSGVKK